MTTKERLYNLLPAIYRIRDVEQGEPLRALMSVLEAEFERLERDIDASYRNWFIETCEEWVVAYIGDLLGARPLRSIPGAAVASLRAYIANTLTYRRRKGTAAVLEQLAWDVAGWRACVVESWRRLDTAQHMNHLRPDCPGTIDVRDPSDLELIGGPFERASHTVEARRAVDGGRYRIPTIALSIWRLRSYPLKLASARSISIGTEWKGFTFSPLGLDTQLVNPRPRAELDIAHIAEEVNVPGNLRRWALYDELEARRAEGEEHEPVFFDEHPPFEIYVGTNTEPIPPEKIAICNLFDWRKPVADGIEAAVDPELGRITFPDTPSPPTSVCVDYAYAFSGDIGAGPYDRQAAVDAWLPKDPEEITFQVGVSKSIGGNSGPVFDTIGGAVAAWHSHTSESSNMGKKLFGVITIMDSASYEESFTSDNIIKIPAGCTLAIVAADWPLTPSPDDPAALERKIGNLIPDGLLPHLALNISVQGTPGVGATRPGELILDGLLLESQLTALGGDLGKLRVSCCTLAPKGNGLQVNVSHEGGPNANLELECERTIIGPVNLLSESRSVGIRDSIVDAAGAAAITASGTPARIVSSTILGETSVRSLEATDSIFEKRVVAERTQAGCVRFSYVGESIDSSGAVLPSRTPRRYHCQPDLALEREARRLNKEKPSDLDDDVRKLIRSRVAPVFTSRTYGKAAYAQLAKTCAAEIKRGAEDGSEMGAFHHLQQPHREANLRTALQEYVPFGMEILLDFVT